MAGRCGTGGQSVRLGCSSEMRLETELKPWGQWLQHGSLTGGVENNRSMVLVAGRDMLPNTNY